MKDPDSIGLGVIGCGGFGLFAMQQFAQVAGIRPVAITATHRPATLQAVARFGLQVFDDIDQMLRSDEVQLVYIATPPFLHHQQAAAALEAGKHVIVEKPLATSVEQADDLIARAERQNRLIVANLMQPYNPLRDVVAEIIDQGWLGKPLHGYFENYASDESLPPEHWFWDPEKSGGIFIEHGVHFFDLFAGWLGDGRVTAASTTRRATAQNDPAPPLEDQVQCTVRYPGGTTVDYYHGFTQPARMDRQELRILLERGDITLEGWVPTSLRIRAIADEPTTRSIADRLPGHRLSVSHNYAGKDRHCRGHGQDYDVYQQFELVWQNPQPKLSLYCDLLRRFAEDQAAWIGDRQHRRRVTAGNGRDSLALAVAARRLALEPAGTIAGMSS